MELELIGFSILSLLNQSVVLQQFKNLGDSYVKTMEVVL